MSISKAERAAIFLDRDGTIIYDVGYPNDPQQVPLLPAVAESLVTLQEWGFLLVLVSNQSGIGRGRITTQQAEAVHQEFVSRLAQHSVHFDDVYYCPHAPANGCRCRKPSPGMLLQAAQELKIDLAQSFMVGDKSSDVKAGQRAGCQTILLGAGNLGDQLQPAPDHIAASWSDVLQFISIRAEVIA